MITEKNKDLITRSSRLSFFILLNKPIGFFRDILQTRYFGLGLISDAYIIAWRIPNVFRRIFGEGLLNNVLLPDLVKIEKQEGLATLNNVVSLIIIIMQCLITIICILISYYSYEIITLLSPGALDRIVSGSQMLRILSFFTFFMSLSSILGVAVQLRNNFYVGPQSQFILNLLFCLELYFAQKYTWSYLTISFLIVANGIAILLIHLLTFFYYNFYFCIPTKKAITHSVVFFKKFFLALISSLLLESNSFLGLSISSYLKPGLLSLFELLLTLIRVPQQIFGSALASTINIEIINLIHDKSDELPNRVYPIFKFFLLLSAAIFFCVYTFSDIFFNVFFYFANINYQFIPISSNLLLIMAGSLFPALCNKILLNMYYAHEKIVLSTFITFFVTICYNFFLFFFISDHQLYAFAVGYFLSDWLRFFILYYILYRKYGFNLLSKNKVNNLKNNFLLLLFLLMLFFSIEKMLSFFIISTFIFKHQIFIFVALFFTYLSYILINKKKI
jgi:putative peptidoglycan lipid II flippase